MAQLVKKGKAAINQGKYQDALDFFNRALAKDADDTESNRGAGLAKEALDRAAADDTAQKKRADYNALLDRGVAYLNTQEYAKAFDTALDAQHIIPDDQAAKALQRQAEQGLASLKDGDTKKQQYKDIMAQADNAMKSNRPDIAMQAYQQALKLIPGDQPAQQGLANAQQADQQLTSSSFSWTRASSSWTPASSGRHLTPTTAREHDVPGRSQRSGRYAKRPAMGRL